MINDTKKIKQTTTKQLLIMKIDTINIKHSAFTE